MNLPVTLSDLERQGLRLVGGGITESAYLEHKKLMVARGFIRPAAASSPAFNGLRSGAMSVEELALCSKFGIDVTAYAASKAKLAAAGR